MSESGPRPLAHYRITAALGAGGMGEVYRATDTKLNREVAIKVLPAEVAGDAERLARFKREAQLLASLNHPHIAAIHGLEEADAKPFLVLELVEGEELAELLTRGPIPVEEALGLARQIAEALEDAHEHGIIHRDLKPANVKVTPDGKVKVLDFGLAKAFESDGGARSGSSALTHSPTLSRHMTEAGMILGTAAYMSPEQARGKAVDKRTDIWALGVVLFEMLAGQRLFAGETLSDTLAAVLRADVAWSGLPATTPFSVRWLLGRCLDRDPKTRLRDVGEAVRVLRSPADALPVGPGQTASAHPRPAFTLRLVAAIVLATIAGAVVGWALLRPGLVADAPPTRFTIPVPTGHVMREQETSSLALSPDGRTLVYATAGRLYKRSLSSETSEPLPGTELAFGPFFSRDGRDIAFSQGDALRRMSIDGGPVTRVAAGAVVFGADWGVDGSIVFTTRGALWRRAASGGASKQITALGPGEIEHAWPQIVDGGGTLIFTALGNSGLWSDARVVALDLGSGRRTVIREQATSGRFVPPGHVVYADANGTLSAIRFDPDRLETLGDPFPVESGVCVAAWGGGASFAVSRTGALAFVRGSSLKSQLVWSVDRRGRRLQLGEPTTIATLDLSPDGRRIAVDPFLPSGLDVWLMDAATGARERVTFVPPGTFAYESPVWAPDGRRIAYAFQADQAMRFHALTLEGGKDEFLFVRPHHHHLQDWSPDGAWVLLEEGHPERRSDMVAVQLAPGNRDVAVAATAASEPSGRFSPDGKWVAYQSDESGRDEVYVASFPSVDRRRQISTDGGRFPRWSRTGAELFYWRDSTLMAMRVSTTGSFGREDAAPLFTMDDADPSYSRWDASADGQRFLIGGRNPEAPAREIHMVLDWNTILRNPGSPKP